MANLLQYAFPAADNIIDLLVAYLDDDGTEQPLDLSPAERVVLTVYGANAGADLVLDSDVDAGLSWSESGRITVAAQGAALDVGEYRASLRVYDPGHANGQYLAYPGSASELTIRVLGD